MPPGDNKHFATLLKSYRSHRTTIGDLIEGVVEVFARTADHFAGLFEGFRQFVPPKHLSIYDAIACRLQEGASLPAGNRIADGQRSSTTHEAMATASPPEGAAATACAACKAAPPANGYRARCGHVCCLSCWNSWLQIRLACPSCQARTRIPQLKRV